MSTESTTRRSFGNILSQFSAMKTEKSLEITGKRKYSNTPCFFCQIKGKKNSQCNKCKKIACQVHSCVMSTGNTERTCDECIKNSLKKEHIDYENRKEAISLKIEDLVIKREELIQKLNMDNTKFRNLQHDLKEALQQKEKLGSEGGGIIETIRNENSMLQKNSQNCDAEIEKGLRNIEFYHSSLNEIKTESEGILSDINGMVQDRTLLLSNLNELREFIRLQVPVKLIKKIVCSACYVSVQNAFAHNFKTVVPVKPEIAQKVKVRKGACNSCEIF